MISENPRSLFISPPQLGFLYALTDVMNSPPVIEFHKTKINFPSIFFSTMIQSGVEKFTIVGGQDYFDNIEPSIRSEFIANRIINSPNDYVEFIKIFNKIKSIFEKNLEIENISQDNKFEIFATEAFLTDLFYGMKKNLCIVSVTLDSYPNMNKLKSIISPELYYPLNNLLSSFENQNLNSPIPTKSILHQNIRDYENIITSDIFQEYVDSHKKLEQFEYSKPEAVKQIAIKANSLKNKFSNLISLKHLTITTIDNTPRVAELLGGKICGEIADYSIKIFGPILNNYLTGNRRMIIYQFSPVSKEIFDNRIMKHLG